MEEEQLRPIERAKTCEVPLVQQCLPNGAVGLSCDPPDSFVEVPVGPEQVRPEMPDDRVLRRRWNQLDDRKPVSHRIMITGGEYRPDFERRPTSPALPMRVDLPSTVHPEMGVQGEVVAEAKELVLAARDHFAHGNTGQTGRCEGGHAEFGSGQHAASKHLVKPLAYPPDGVSLRHDLIVPCQVRARIMTTPSIAIVSSQAGSKRASDPYWAHASSSVLGEFSATIHNRRERHRWQLSKRRSASLAWPIQTGGSIHRGIYPWGVRWPPKRDMFASHRLAQLLWLVAGMGIAGLAAVAGSVRFVRSTAAGHIYAEYDVPKAPAALALGAQVNPDGTPSAFLAARLELAKRLFDAGIVEMIIVSGDHLAPEFDEPAAMRDYLIRAGLPTEKVIADPGGFDTYESCLRAKRTFNLTRLIVVTQSYHLVRAVATCRALGIDATGVGDDSARQHTIAWWRGTIRDQLACVKTVVDLATRSEPMPDKPQSAVAASK